MRRPMIEMLPFRIGGQTRNFLLVEVIARSYPGCFDSWDGNWLNTKISVQAGAFSGHYYASLLSYDFASLLRQLKIVYNSLGTQLPTYIVEFTTMEEQLSFIMRGNALGNFVAECVCVDFAGTGNRLEFEIEFDQSYIPSMLNELEAITEAFPVRGNPATS